MINDFTKNIYVIVTLIIIGWVLSPYSFLRINVVEAAQFGSTGSGAFNSTRSDAFCAPFTMPATGTVTSMSTQMSGTSLTGAFAIYTDNGLGAGSNLPVNLVAQSSTFTVPSSQGWATSTISATLTGGTIYWLCEWANGIYTYYYDEPDGINKRDFSGGMTWPTWYSPWADAGSHATREPTIYATYTVATTRVVKMNKPPNYLTTGSGLVGWWTFDGNKMYQNVADSSGSGNNGSLILGATGNTSTTTVPGKIGQALSFDGVDDYVLGPVVGTNIGPSTFSAWIYPKSGNASVIMGIGCYVGEDKYFNIYLNGTNNQLKFSHSTTNVGVHYATSDNAISLNKWQHVVATWDGTVGAANNVHIYVNGVEVSYSLTTTGSGAAEDLSAYRIIAGASQCVSKYFNGSLDDVRIYNRALSASEIGFLYRTGQVKTNKVDTPTNLQGGLVGYWTFDGNKMYQNVADSSGSGNNGSLILGASGNTSTTTVPGKLGQALEFDGVDDYINLGQPTTLDMSSTNAFTISAWIYPTNNAVSWKEVFTRGSGGSTSANSEVYQFGQYAFSQRWRAVVSDGTTQIVALSNDGDLVLNKWQHVVVTWNGANKTLTIYKDKVSIASATDAAFTSIWDGGATSVNRNTGIGFSARDVSDFFGGTVDDLRIYNRVLSQAEITQLYQLGGAKIKP